MASCRCCGRVGSRATGSDSSAPGSQRDGTIGVDLNGAFSRARGPERRRPPRSGIVAAAPAFSFLIFFFDFGFDFTRPLVFSLGGAAGVDLNGELPLLRPRWVASDRVGFECTRLATRWHYGVDLNGAFSRARGPERRRPPRSGIVAAAPAFSFLIFFFDFGFDFTRPLVFSLGGAAGVDLNGELPLLRPRWVASDRVGFECTRLATCAARHPKDRLEALRAAFLDTMKDPAYIAQAKKLKLDTETWQTGDAVERIVSEALSLSPALIQKAKAAIDLP